MEQLTRLAALLYVVVRSKISNGIGSIRTLSNILREAQANPCERCAINRNGWQLCSRRQTPALCLLTLYMEMQNTPWFIKDVYQESGVWCYTAWRFALNVYCKVCLLQRYVYLCEWEWIFTMGLADTFFTSILLMSWPISTGRERITFNRKTHLGR